MQAWKQDNLVVAESYWTKAKTILDGLTPPDVLTAESLADLAYEIGKGLKIKNATKMATKWFERCCDALSIGSGEALSDDAMELKLSAMDLLGKYLIRLLARIC